MELKKMKTAINVAAVVVILGLIALTALLALRPPPCGSREQKAKIDVAAIRATAQLYRAQFPGRCPDVERLFEVGFLERRRRVTDPWEQDYVIECDDDDVIVFSLGPDGLPDTEDDVR